MKICGIVCARDSHQVLGTVLTHLVVNGISDFYLYDHHSDPTLASFLASTFGGGSIRLRILRKETPPFFQRAMDVVLIELARIDGFEAAVAFDSDEFWCSTVPGHSLREQIAALMEDGVDGLRVPVTNYVQHRDVDVFSTPALCTCRYAVEPHVDPTRSQLEQVDAGMPFVAMPFPAKTIPRLAAGITLLEGRHGIVKNRGQGTVVDAKGIVVRHLPFSCRTQLSIKREQGRRRIAGGYSPDIGWHLQRLAHMTDGELHTYWDNNSWQFAEDQRALVGSYDRLIEDDALVQIGDALARKGDRPKSRGATHAKESTLVEEIPAERLERVVESLVDEYGLAEHTVSVIEQEYDQRLAGLQNQLDDRTAWALRLDAQLAQRECELLAIKSSLPWRTARAIYRTFRPRSLGGS